MATKTEYFANWKPGDKIVNRQEESFILLNQTADGWLVCLEQSSPSVELSWKQLQSFAQLKAVTLYLTPDVFGEYSDHQLQNFLHAGWSNHKLLTEICRFVETHPAFSNARAGQHKLVLAFEKLKELLVV